MLQTMKICVIIPTKNRPDDLEVAVRSIFGQTIGPASLIVVDQSSDFDSRRRVYAELALAERRRGARWKLQYVYDPEISGAAMARNRAMAIADGDIWLFLDDDVILEADFVEQLLAVYRSHPQAAGVSGIITNYPFPSLPYRLWSATFVRGPFRDERQPLYWNADRLRNSPPAPVSRFGGGLMSFRAEAMQGTYFDENLKGVSDGEDVDFCARLPRGSVLLLAPSARLVHKGSPVERLQDHWMRRYARGNFFLYHKHWNETLSNRICYWWLWLGFSAVATTASARRWSLEPWRALLRGAREARQAIPQSSDTRLDQAACTASPAPQTSPPSRLRTRGISTNVLIDD